MCVKLLLGNLNPSSYLPHPTSIYTCGSGDSKNFSQGVPKFFLVERSKAIQGDESWVRNFFIKYLSIILAKE